MREVKLSWLSKMTLRYAHIYQKHYAISIIACSLLRIWKPVLTCCASRAELTCS